MPRKKIKAKRGQSVPEALVNPLKNSHGGTVRMVANLRAVRGKLPRAVRSAYPKF